MRKNIDETIETSREPGSSGPKPSKKWLPAHTRDHLGNELRTLYGSLASDNQPQRLLDLLEQLDTALAGHQLVEVETFRQGLTKALPVLRRFAISLTANSTQADDLVQETFYRAWANQHRFMRGTNLTGWLITIARNAYYSECRRRKREVEDADGAAASKLIAFPAQERSIELQEVLQAMLALPAVQREALMLVGAQGMSYEAAAELIGCQVGTVKSRVSRARSYLTKKLVHQGLKA